MPARRRATWLCGLVVAVLVSVALPGGVVARAATGTQPDPLSAASLMTTVRAYAGLAPDHLTDSSHETATQDWLATQLRDAGLTVGRSYYTYLGFRPTHVSLTTRGYTATDVDAYLYSGVTPDNGVAAPLVDVGLGLPGQVTSAHVRGKIAVVTVPDVDGLTPTFATAYGAVAKQHAAGLVAVTDGPDGLPVQQDVDSRAGVGRLPTVIVGSRAATALEAAAKAGKTARLTLSAYVGRSCTSDVWATLPGTDPNRDEVIGTPTSAYDAAASERGAGVAALVGLARHYAAMPRSQRPVGLVFAGLSGHEVGYLGFPVLLATHPDWFAAADAYLHLGASVAAVAQTPGASAQPLPIGDPTRSLYVSENPLLEATSTAAFAGAQPLLTTPPGISDPGEQSLAYADGIPIVAESGSSAWFHTTGDTPAGVSGSALAAVANGFGRELDLLAKLPPGKVSLANQVADELAMTSSASTTPAGKLGADVDPPIPVSSCRDPRPIQPPVVAAAKVAKSDLPIGLGEVGGYEASEPSFAWEGTWQQRTVLFPSAATGATLYGVEFAPQRTPPGRRRPAVVIVPGSGPGVESFYEWSARDLAGHGYVALVVDPQGVGRSGAIGSPPCRLTIEPGQATPCPGVPFQQSANYVDAAESGIDELLSRHNPYRAVVDPAEIGLAGHSLGARAVSYLQGVDKRVDAVVAWDNLASDLDGDAGSPSGGPPASEIIGGGIPFGPPVPVRPRVPSLGEASDSAGFQLQRGPQIKKTAYDDWVRHGVPSMEVVFRGAQHLDWAQSQLPAPGGNVELERFEYYTRAWFDLFLRHDAGAVRRLLATTVVGKARSDLLSSSFASAVSIPGRHVDCGDLAVSCHPRLG